jgi:pimeloyl-ACP methyl ester carboxylesterase
MVSLFKNYCTGAGFKVGPRRVKVKRRLIPVLGAMFSFAFSPFLHADAPLHAQVLVFLPAYEGSKLYDPDLAEGQEDAPCVWGSLDAIRDANLYLALRMPNPLEARPMVSAGPIDVYGDFVSGITEEQDTPGFQPYTQGADFFVFAYDWRQEIATVTAPLLEQALDSYARIHEEKTGIPAAETKFILVGHSMGGLVARTFLSENPQWADRIAEMILVGTPNLGSVKAIKTLVVGPGGLKENATSFPASLLNLLPSNVDANLTKLVAISRPSLYELLPFVDPHWECVAADGSRVRMSAQDILTIGPWQTYWPSPELERRVYLDDWLKKREAEGRKKIDPPDWEFCQDADLPQLQKILGQVRDWRLRMGSLSYTDTLLTRPGGASRLKVVAGTGIKTPTGVITEGAHDSSLARYTYEPDNDGDETVTGASVLDDLHPAPGQLKLLSGVTHGKLMTDPQFLDYLYGELSHEPMAPPDTRSAVGQTL